MHDRQSQGILVDVAHWFTSPHGTFIEVFGAYRSPHILSLLVIDKVAMKEVGSQLYTGLSGSFKKSNKSPWSIFPLQIGSYELNNLKVEEGDIEDLNRLIFGEMGYHRYDPRGICAQHCAKVRFTWAYALVSSEDE